MTDHPTGALNWATTQTIASAATTDIGAATSNSVIGLRKWGIASV